jgi:hypothetical protein
MQCMKNGHLIACHIELQGNIWKSTLIYFIRCLEVRIFREVVDEYSNQNHTKSFINLYSIRIFPGSLRETLIKELQLWSIEAPRRSLIVEMLDLH